MKAATGGFLNLDRSNKNYSDSYNKSANIRYKKAVSAVKRLPQYKSLSEANKKKVVRALLSGRAYLCESTNNTEKVGNLHYTLVHYGKMKNIISISTSVLENPICQQRRKDKNSICAKCFAASQMNCYKNMRPIFAKNLHILATRILSDNEIPVILSKSGQGRAESFGDACNAIQAANYLKIAKLNPWLNFAIWTKNPQFYYIALQSGYVEKPKNCNIVFSSSKINAIQEVPEKFAYFIDRVFTVYDNKFIEENDIKINCGALSCATCKKCYQKTNKYFHISERLK